MKSIFITGVTGYIGGSVAVQLLKNGYGVRGLIRNKSQEKPIAALGIEPVLGSLDSIRAIEACIDNNDAVINTADADNPFFVATALNRLTGSGKTFIHTSGSSIVAHRDEGERSHTIYDEDMEIDADLEKMGRIAINKAVCAYSSKNVRTIVIVPTLIYGDGLGIKKDSIQAPKMIELAKAKGIGAHIGKGENVWSNVHIEDLADLYVLALEKAPSGSIFYAENGSASFKEIALAINKRFNYGQQTTSIDINEAIKLWGPEGAHFAFGGNSRVRSDKARKVLGWRPKHDSLLDLLAYRR